MLVLLRKRARTPTWTQLVSAELSDPSGLLTGSSGIAGGGVFTFETIDVGAPQVDGVREDVPLFSVRLLDLYPDFDPMQDEVDVRLDFVAFPMNAARYGLISGTIDDGPSGRATWSAGGLYVRPNSATVVAGGQIGPTDVLSASGTIGTDVNPVTGLFTRCAWSTEASPEVRVHGQVTRSGLDEMPLTIVGAPGPAFSPTIANWRLFVALGHFALVDQADNIVRTRIFHRRIRTGSPLG